MSWSSLRGDIYTLLQTVSGIADVQPLPTLDFSGYPAVTVAPSDLESDYESQSENLRTYAFMVTVFYDASIGGVANAINKVEETIDSIIDRIDQEEKIGATRVIGANLPSNYTILAVRPVIHPFLYSQEEDMVVAEISLRVMCSFDIEG